MTKESLIQIMNQSENQKVELKRTFPKSWNGIHKKYEKNGMESTILLYLLKGKCNGTINRNRKSLNSVS
jgi:hypothetical protein